MKEDDRKWGTWDMFFLWGSLSSSIITLGVFSISILEKFPGATIFVIVFLGCCFLLVPLIINAHPGSRYGISFAEFSIASFGSKGFIFPIFLRSAIAIGWFMIQLSIQGYSFLLILFLIFGNQIAPWASGVKFNLLILMVLFINIFFMSNIKRVRMLMWAVPILVFVFFMSMFPVIRTIDIGNIQFFHINDKKLSQVSNPSFIKKDGKEVFSLSRNILPLNPQEDNASSASFRDGRKKANKVLSYSKQTKNEGEKGHIPSFIYFIGFVIAIIGYWITLAVNISDFSKYCRIQRHQITGQVLGIIFWMLIMIYPALYIILRIKDTDMRNVQMIGKALGGGNDWLLFLLTLIIFFSALNANVLANYTAPVEALRTFFKKTFKEWTENIEISLSAFLPTERDKSVKLVKFLSGLVGFFLGREGDFLTLSFVGFTACIGLLFLDISNAINLPKSFIWLGGLSWILGPVCGILVSDYFIRGFRLHMRGLRYGYLGGIYLYNRGWNPLAFKCTAVGLILIFTLIIISLKVSQVIVPLGAGFVTVGITIFFMAHQKKNIMRLFQKKLDESWKKILEEIAREKRITKSLNDLLTEGVKNILSFPTGIPLDVCVKYLEQEFSDEGTENSNIKDEIVKSLIKETLEYKDKKRYYSRWDEKKDASGYKYCEEINRDFIFTCISRHKSIFLGVFGKDCDLNNIEKKFLAKLLNKTEALLKVSRKIDEEKKSNPQKFQELMKSFKGEIVESDLEFAYGEPEHPGYSFLKNVLWVKDKNLIKYVANYLNMIRNEKKTPFSISIFPKGEKWRLDDPIELKRVVEGERNRNIVMSIIEDVGIILEEKLDQTASKIYEFLSKKDIEYHLPLGDRITVQNVRSFKGILEGKRGCCTDVALFYIACLKEAGLQPLYFLLKDKVHDNYHLLAGYWVKAEGFGGKTYYGNTYLFEPYAGPKIREEVNQGYIIPVESLGFVKDGIKHIPKNWAKGYESDKISFEDAVNLGKAIINSEEVIIVSAVWVRAGG